MRDSGGRVGMVADARQNDTCWRARPRVHDDSAIRYRCRSPDTWPYDTATDQHRHQSKVDRRHVQRAVLSRRLSIYRWLQRLVKSDHMQQRLTHQQVRRSPEQSLSQRSRCEGHPGRVRRRQVFRQHHSASERALDGGFDTAPGRRESGRTAVIHETTSAPPVPAVRADR